METSDLGEGIPEWAAIGAKQKVASPWFCQKQFGCLRLGGLSTPL
jgi:hypothetical protein